MLNFSPFFTAYFYFVTAVLGLVCGSFVNCWAWRLANGEKISHGRSHCAKCGHVLAARDLVPLVSYLFLHGKCRYCGERISRRYPAAEVVSAVFFLSVLFVYGVSFDTLRWWLVGAFLLTLSLVDLDIFEIPDRLQVGIALAFLLRWFTEGRAGLLNGLIGAFAVSVPLLLFVLLADRVMGKETMGGGDVKLMFVLGLHFGPAFTLMTLIFACFFGVIFGIAIKNLKGHIPFGPAISAAAWVTLLVGRPFLTWYLGLF